MRVSEPGPPEPNWPRYCTRPFPPYRYLPGLTPHPHRDPRGHSYGRLLSPLPAFAPSAWRTSVAYLYGIDLYNFAFWWECHETFEGLWHAVGRHTMQGRFLRALIQLAAANLKHHLGSGDAARSLATRALVELERAPATYLGVDVPGLTAQVRARLAGTQKVPPLIRLTRSPEPSKPQPIPEEGP